MRKKKKEIFHSSCVTNVRYKNMYLKKKCSFENNRDKECNFS